MIADQPAPFHFYVPRANSCENKYTLHVHAAFMLEELILYVGDLLNDVRLYLILLLISLSVLIYRAYKPIILFS